LEALGGPGLGKTDREPVVVRVGRCQYCGDFLEACLASRTPTFGIAHSGSSPLFRSTWSQANMQRYGAFVELSRSERARPAIDGRLKRHFGGKRCHIAQPRKQTNRSSSRPQAA
jgi:hypothetical protein